MNYLMKYNITPEQIQEIEEVLKKRNINSDIFIYDPEKIITILNLFVKIGVTNIYDIIVTSPSMFCDTIKSIKQRIDNYGNTVELARLINEDAANLFLADLM